MRAKSNPKENSTTGIIAKAPWRLKSVTPLPDYKLAVEFNDDTHGVATWPGGIDFAPDAMYEQIKQQAA